MPTYQLPETIAVSRDGNQALALMEVQRPGSRGRVLVEVRSEPQGEPSTVIVTFERMDLARLKEHRSRTGMSEIVVHAIAMSLTEGKLGHPVEAGTEVRGDEALFAVLSPKTPQQPATEEVLDHIAGKVYWSWAHGLTPVGFTGSEFRRFGIPGQEFLRIAMLEHGRYWTFEPGDRLAATSRLLRDYRTGLVGGATQPLLGSIRAAIRAPRYRPVSLAFDEAVDALHGEEPNWHHAVARMVRAVEDAGHIALSMDSGTLGDVVKELRRRSTVHKALLKAVEGLWGFASEEAGIRHGKGTVPATSELQARFAVNLGAAAIGLFLDLDS